MPYKKEISNTLRMEKIRFTFNQCFSKIFSNIDLQTVLIKQSKPEKLIVRTKVGWQTKLTSLR